MENAKLGFCLGLVQTDGCCRIFHWMMEQIVINDNDLKAGSIMYNPIVCFTELMLAFGQLGLGDGADRLV